MEVNTQLPFNQLLGLVKNLTPAQKAQLRQALEQEPATHGVDEAFTKFLLKGPVYTEADIQLIEENRKNIAAWRTKD